MDYVTIAVLVMISYIIGRILAPILIYALKLISGKTKSTLDDYILKEIEGPLESIFFIFIIYLLPKYVDFFKFSNELIDKFIIAGIFLSATFFAVKIIKALCHWYYEDGHNTSKLKIDLTLLPFLQKFFQILAALIGITFVMNELGFNVSAIIAITSVMGIILGLASQETLANLFAGLALQLDRPYKYGDLIRLPSGEIVRLRKIGIRSTKLFDSSENKIIISNSEFAKQRINVLGDEKDGFEVFIPFEAPLSLSVEELEQHLIEKIKKTNIVGIKDPAKTRLFVNRVKVPGWYEGIIEISMNSLGKMGSAVTKVNKILIEKINSKQNNRKK